MRRTRWPAAPFLLVLAVLLVAALSLWLRSRVPVHAIPYAGYDDALFVRQAGHLVRTGWLGPYDALTLAKGPGYPVFLAAAHEVGLGLKTAEQLVQLLAAGLLGWGASASTRRRWLGLVVYAVAALDPAYLSVEAARVNRTGLYASLGTALVGALLLCGSLEGRRRWVLAVPAGLVTGILLGALLVTREERVTLLPVLVAVGLATLVRAGRRIGPAALALALALGTAGAGFVAVQERNERAYGTAAVTDFVDGAFPELFDALGSIEAGEPRPYVPISRLQREAAYGASPTFARLRDALEGAALATWVPPGCAAVAVCDDLAGGWAPWALRQAVFGELPGASAPQVQAFLREAADEVTGACGSAYACRSSPLPFLPDPGGVDVGGVLSATVEGLRVLPTFDTPSAELPPGTAAEQAPFAGLVEGVRADPLAEARLVADETTWPRDLARSAYGLLLVVGALPALAGLLSPRDRGQRLVQVVGLAVAAVALTRVGLLAVVEVTSFPAVATGYLLPAFDPAAVAVLLGCWSLGVVVISYRRALRDVHVPDGPEPAGLVGAAPVGRGAGG